MLIILHAASQNTLTGLGRTGSSGAETFTTFHEKKVGEIKSVVKRFLRETELANYFCGLLN